MIKHGQRISVQDMVRVLLLPTDRKLRDFYWFGRGKDTSLYYGSSCRFKKGFYETNLSVNKAGLTFDAVKQGKQIQPSYLPTKYSYHASGQLLLPKTSEVARKAHFLPPLVSNAGPTHLLTILPMEPSRYPISRKKPTSKDFIIDACWSVPLGILVYLKQPNSPDPPIISIHPWKWHHQAWICVGPQPICLFLYIEGEPPYAWPGLEMQFTAPPSDGKLDPSWPIARTNVE